MGKRKDSRVIPRQYAWVIGRLKLPLNGTGETSGRASGGWEILLC